MNIIILLIILIVASIIGIIVGIGIDNNTYSAWGFGLVLVSVIVLVISFVTGILVLFEKVDVPKQINNFEKQKQYIETHITQVDIENAALTNKKVELNSWLYNAQYFNKTFGGWSFYPDEVQELKPIE